MADDASHTAVTQVNGPVVLTALDDTAGAPLTKSAPIDPATGSYSINVQPGNWLVTYQLDSDIYQADLSTARLWDMRAADPSAQPIVLRGHTGEVVAVAFSPDGRTLASGSWDGTARVWDLSSGTPNADPIILHGHTKAVVDSRGLARALTGDPTGAADDFAAYIAWEQQQPAPDTDAITQREQWIADLKAGRAPFDKATLEELRVQSYRWPNSSL